MPPIPKPEPRATAKARHQRQRATAHRAVYAAVTARDGSVCRVCQARDSLLMHRHHIVYRSKGGATTSANVALVCGACHADIHAGRIHLAGDADGPLAITRRQR